MRNVFPPVGKKIFKSDSLTSKYRPSTINYDMNFHKLLILKTVNYELC